MDKPLYNRKIVVTRDKNQAMKLVDALKTYGAECLLFPTIKISATDDWTNCDKALQKINNYQWIVFTSANGIRYFFGRAKEIGAKKYKSKIAVVGKKTLRELKSSGFKADLIPETFSAEGLIKSFQNESIAGMRILIPTSKITRDELQTGLERLGADVDTITVYHNECQKSLSTELILEAVEQNSIDAVLFFSPSAFTCFTKILGSQVTNNISRSKAVIAAIGATTADTIESAGFKVGIIPEEGTQESMVQAIMNYFENQN